eukprot:scaffold9432_cov49-Cyclotella_meneghiniana.AAC.2
MPIDQAATSRMLSARREQNTVAVCDVLIPSDSLSCVVFHRLFSMMYGMAGCWAGSSPHVFQRE